MNLRTIYALWCGLLGLMIGAVLAAVILIISALIAWVSTTGLSSATKILLWVLLALALAVPTALGAYAGIRWASRIEQKDTDPRIEKEKAYIFLGITIIAAAILAIAAVVLR